MKKFLGLILLMLLPCSTLSMWGQTGQQMKLISYNIWNGFEANAKKVSIEYRLVEACAFYRMDSKTGC